MLRIQELLRDAREHDEGVSIVEVLVAMTVFAIIAAGVALGITSSLYLAHGSRSREVAIGLAQDAIDSARTATNLFGVVDGTSSRTVGGQDYTIKQTARWVSTSGTANACGAGGGPLAYKRVSLTVSWTSRTEQSVSMNSMVAPSTSVTAANLGTIIVSVARVDGSGNQGVSVGIAPNASNPSGATAITSTIAKTDGTGCTYALNVKPGRYDVTLTKSGNIDDGTSSGSLRAQTATPSTTVTVEKNQSSAANFTFDEALSVAPQWADPTVPSATFRSPTSAPVTLRHKTADYGPYAAGTTTKVFPFPDGYKTIAGTPAKCASVDPENWTTPKGTAVAPRNDPQPNGLTNAVRAPVQLVTVKFAKGTDNAFRATNTSPVTGSGDPGCATGASYTFTGLSGGTAVVALPYGTYTFQSGTVLSIVNGVVTLSTTATATATTATGVSTTSGKVLLDPRRVPAS
uniref:Type II secretion system protein n=1 Tax=Neobacillus citreus TaxID=2833578 RepID=A0A942Y8W4_9BACI